MAPRSAVPLVEFQKGLNTLVLSLDSDLDLTTFQQGKPYDFLDSLAVMDLAFKIEKRFQTEILETQMRDLYLQKDISYGQFVSSWYEVYLTTLERKT